MVRHGIKLGGRVRGGDVREKLGGMVVPRPKEWIVAICGVLDGGRGDVGRKEDGGRRRRDIV